MPELASFFLVGFLLSLSANITNVIVSIRAFRKPEILILQKNLEKVGCYWSFTDRAVSKVPPSSDFQESLKQDRKWATRSVMLFAALLTATSWLGLAGLGLYAFSVHVLAKSRMEHKIFGSTLVSQELSREEVAKILKDYEA